MIQDSGNRREFETGAVRDIQEGKGRCDLLPLGEVASLIFDKGTESEIIRCIEEGIELGQPIPFYAAIKLFCKSYMGGVINGVLEVSKHFEEGAIKYGEWNWQKGIPCHCYIDSGVRHLLKFLRGDTDERHDRAFIWNMLCLIWTLNNRPECNDIWEDDFMRGFNGH